MPGWTNSWTLNDGKTIYDYEMKNDSIENDSIENVNRYFLSIDEWSRDCYYLQRNIFKFFTYRQVLYSQSLHLHTEKLWRSLLHLAPDLDPGAVMRKPLGMLMLGIFLFSMVKSTGKNNNSSLTWDFGFLDVHFKCRHNMQNWFWFYPFI